MSVTNFLYDTLDAFSSADSQDAKWVAANVLSAELGGNSLTMGCVGTNDGTPRWMRSTMSTGWLSEYVDQKHYQSDRLTEHTKVSRSALTISAGTETSHDDMGWYNLNHGLLDAGYKSLHLIPFDSGVSDARNAVTFNSEFSTKSFFCTDFLAKFRILSTFMVANIGAPDTQTNDDSGEVALPETGLAGRERETLEYLAHGLRNAQIAHIMGIAEISVRKNILSARRKLKADTREQAIALAVKRGFIAL